MTLRYWPSLRALFLLRKDGRVIIRFSYRPILGDRVWWSGRHS